MEFPHYTSGKVVKGFGRGSKQLGIPTANYDNTLLPPQYIQGVYYGWAQVNDGNVYKMVMSVGDNPHFNNEKKTMEVYVIHKFNDDFYGSNLKTIITGFIRPMMSFASNDELIKAMHDDIEKANILLEEPGQQRYKNDTFFKPIRITNF